MVHEMESSNVNGSWNIITYCLEKCWALEKEFTWFMRWKKDCLCFNFGLQLSLWQIPPLWVDGRPSERVSPLFILVWIFSLTFLKKVANTVSLISSNWIWHMLAILAIVKSPDFGPCCQKRIKLHKHSSSPFA